MFTDVCFKGKVNRKGRVDPGLHLSMGEMGDVAGAAPVSVYSSGS